MENKIMNGQKLANFLAENVEKEKIIATVFDFFRFDCLERGFIDNSQLDDLINRFEANEECDTELLAAIIETMNQGRESIKNKENDLVREIVTRICDDLFSDISLMEIADELNISYHYMCHIFKAKHGISANTFRNKKRLEAAMRKLVEGDEKISRIAISCGFNNVSYFTETFSKMVGIAPRDFRAANKGLCFHKFYTFEDMLLATMMEGQKFLAENVETAVYEEEPVVVHRPDERFAFLHEAAVIEYRGVLYASWYNCVKHELQGYTPVCGRRSKDGGKTWSDLEILCEDPTEKILYCPPVYGICDGKLYMLVNQMVAADRMHAIDLYVLDNETEKFQLLWTKDIPFKLNTNVVALPNGKLMLPGRIAEPDGFPNTPAVLISDSGKIDSEWRLVKIAENGDLPDGKALLHPEISVMCAEDTLYMFNRNDHRKVPLVYVSKDCGESWSAAMSHDIPYVSSKMYAGNLSSGKRYLVANIDEFDRSKLAVYFTGESGNFEKCLVLFDDETTNIQNAVACHYPCAWEEDGRLYIIATLGYRSRERGAVLFAVDLSKY